MFHGSKGAEKLTSLDSNSWFPISFRLKSASQAHHCKDFGFVITAISFVFICIILPFLYPPRWAYFASLVVWAVFYIIFVGKHMPTADSLVASTATLVVLAAFSIPIYMFCARVAMQNRLHPFKNSFYFALPLLVGVHLNFSVYIFPNITLSSASFHEIRALITVILVLILLATIFIYHLILGYRANLLKSYAKLYGTFSLLIAVVCFCALPYYTYVLQTFSCCLVGSCS